MVSSYETCGMIWRLLSISPVRVPPETLLERAWRRAGERNGAMLPEFHRVRNGDVSGCFVSVQDAREWPSACVRVAVTMPNGRTAHLELRGLEDEDVYPKRVGAAAIGAVEEIERMRGEERAELDSDWS